MKKVLVAVILSLLVFSKSYAAHPLITDDTGTQGTGKFQLELNSEYGIDKEDGVTTKTFEFAPTLSYGLTDNIDIVVGVPYQHIKVEDTFTTKESGISDSSIEIKWRFFDKDGLSLALKPGVSIPTGDKNKGLGSGKVGYSTYLILTKELKPLNLHINFGYIRNENKFDERKDIFHASLAGEFEVTEKLRVVANIGRETNPDKADNTSPSFVLAGAIYSVTENISIDAGYKFGLNTPEVDNTYLVGIALKF